MPDKITIMIVDDNPLTRNSIRELLEPDQDMVVICEAATGEDAIKKAEQMTPDVILMDVYLPGMDGIAATEVIMNEVPESLVIMVSAQGDQKYLRRAMLAGARDYLVKPFDADELLQCIRNIYLREQKLRAKLFPLAPKQARGKVVAVFSTKGGVGKTTISTNLAVALGIDHENRVGIVDMNLQFGDVALCLNLAPQKTIADLVREVEDLDASVLDNYMTGYKDNVKLLAAPSRPEQADSVAAGHIAAIIKEMQYQFDYIIIDTAPVYNEIIFTALDLSDIILVVTSHDVLTVKNAKLCLETLEYLKYPEKKIKVMLNRANSLGGMNIKAIEELLQRKALVCLPDDGNTVTTAVTQGIPFVVNNRDAAISQAICQLANFIVSGDEASITVETQRASIKGIINKASQLLKSNDNNKDCSNDLLDPIYWSLS